MELLEVGICVLYLLEWLCGILVWGTTADRLNKAGCYFGKTSNCGGIIFIGAFTWLSLCFLVITTRILPIFDPKYCDWFSMYNEKIMTSVMAAGWALVAIIASATAPMKNVMAAGNAVVAFSWINLLLHIASIAVITVRDQGGVGGERAEESTLTRAVDFA